MPLVAASPVTEIPAADPATVLQHYENLLALETDCWDVHASLAGGRREFVLLDVRSPESFASARLPGAVNLPYRRINQRNLAAWPGDTLFVVYCNGPHCNGADRAAVRLARLGRKVKKMIGGVEGWKDEGLHLESGRAAQSRGGFMKFLAVIATLVPLVALAADEAGTPSKSTAAFARHWAAARKLAVAVAEAMPPAQYEFRPDPGSMSFGEQIAHVAQTNYSFCAGLKDSQPPAMPAAAGKDSLVRFLGDSFDYCSAVIATLTDDQLENPHSSPDGRLIGRECLLALYGHMAHHRGQQEVYLRVKGIHPPSYIF